jgi:co-chaperonin GroES (HSP10)
MPGGITYVGPVANPSGLHPLGRAVLVKPYDIQKEASIIAIPQTAKERSLAIETRAVVLEIGSEAWVDERQPRAKVGDHVFISKFAGIMATGVLDNEPGYRLVNDNDIFCQIEEGT